jgi:hypothetical protein
MTKTGYGYAKYLTVAGTATALAAYTSPRTQISHRDLFSVVFVAHTSSLIIYVNFD